MTPPKHTQIYNKLREAIEAGKYAAGQKLPSESQLVKQFGASRPTVGRALRDLQVESWIERRAGSGSYVRGESRESHLIGMIIPKLGETEIFDPICREMAHRLQARDHSLLWATPEEYEGVGLLEQMTRLCGQLIARKVAGVFLAPLELTADYVDVNQRIASILDRASIPIVLLDRDLLAYPKRSRYDRVGINNRLAGHVITEHLLKLGSRRIAFVNRPNSAETVWHRRAGYADALKSYAVDADPQFHFEGDPADSSFVNSIVKSGVEACVCANDMTAATLMHTLDGLGVHIPEDLRIVGMDDVRYASLLRVPLTTIHQPCKHIGMSAVTAMMERIAHPDIPARDILVDFKLVVRESCGAGLHRDREVKAPILA